jgi:plastocyanin
MRARLLALFAVVLLPVVVAGAAGAGGGGHGLCSGFSKGTEIAVRDSCFQSVAHVVPAGSTITVTNQGQLNHNLIAVDGGFGIKELLPGKQSEFEVDRPGVYEYYCGLHGSPTGGGMAGVLIVEENASLAAARADDGTLAPEAPATATTTQSGSAWGWVALGALLLAGAALCVSLAVIRPRPR